MHSNSIRPSEELNDSVGKEVLGVDDDDDDEMVMKAVAEAEGEDLGKHVHDSDSEAVNQGEDAFKVSEEAVVPRQLRRPDQPTQRQIDDHRQAGHIPYRSWCKCCVEGRGLHDQHMAGAERDKLDKAVPCISIDYAFMGDDVTEANQNAVVCAYDNGTDSIMTYVTKKKGAVLWLPHAIVNDLEALCYSGCRLGLKSDQEKSIMAVKRSIAEVREAPTSMLESPVRESQCNGKMERAVQKWQGQMRTLKLALEENIGRKVPAKSVVFAWLCHWASTAINRYFIGADGKTPFSRVTGTQCMRTIAEFGEQILYKRSSKSHSKKAESQWNEGTFLGLKGRTGEAFVATSRGRVIRCRTIRARPQCERWDADRVLGVRDTVAVGAYNFGLHADVTEFGDKQDEDPEKIVPVGGEDDVARLFASDSEDQDHGGDDAEEEEHEPNTRDSEMTPSEDPSDDDPSKLNLMEDIKRLEGILSVERVETNKRIIMMLATGADITEVFSPPRIAEAAQEAGLIPGESMDLLTGWDFSKQADRQRAIEHIRTKRPFLVVGSPPCTLFSILQGLNKHKLGAGWEAKFEQRKKGAIKHIEFCAAIYRLQFAAGRYWVHEHPESATSWSLKVMVQLHGLPGVIKVRADQCMFGLRTEVDGEVRPAKKPTGFLTNSWCIAKELSRRCDKSHKHFSLMESRAQAAAEYPKQLCQAVCRGIQAQKDYDKKGTCCSRELNSIELRKIISEAGFPEHWNDDYHNDSSEDMMVRKEMMMLAVREGMAYAQYDITGAALPADLVKEARKLEIEYVTKMGVWTKVPKSEAKGKKIIRLRWIDVNKMDADNPMIRSRIVAKEYNDGVDPNMFASTPPIEALRYLLSKAATKGNEDKMIMLNDVSRAFFNAKVSREVYVHLPAEDIEAGEKDLVGRLNLCLYGTRDAAMHWQECVATHLEGRGFVRSRAFPSLYHHEGRNISTLIHGDDYVSVASKEQLVWLKKELEGTFEIKTDLIGHNVKDPDIKGEGKILNRIIKADNDGWKLEADPRHAELLIEEMKIEKELATPGIDEKDEDEPESKLNDQWASRYRSLVARANYLATDRPDIGFSVKELCKSMSSPTNSSWDKLIRVVKYLKRCPRLVISYDWQDEDAELQVYSDANWAGCRKTRKSTSGGGIMKGRHLLKAWSRNQNIVALSSAESEFHATVKAAMEGLGMITMAASFGDKCTVRLHVDASAALGVIQRKGVGKIRHLHTGALWLQEQQVRNVVAFQKINGTMNPADLFTKHLSREAMEKYTTMLGANKTEGRSDKAAQLHVLQRKVRQLRAQVKKKASINKDVDDDSRLKKFEEADFVGYVRQAEGKLEEALDEKYLDWMKHQCRSEGISKMIQSPNLFCHRSDKSVNPTCPRGGAEIWRRQTTQRNHEDAQATEFSNKAKYQYFATPAWRNGILLSGHACDPGSTPGMRNSSMKQPL